MAEIRPLEEWIKWMDEVSKTISDSPCRGAERAKKNRATSAARWRAAAWELVLRTGCNCRRPRRSSLAT
jgi:hypothetical protein